MILVRTNHIRLRVGRHSRDGSLKPCVLAKPEKEKKWEPVLVHRNRRRHRVPVVEKAM
jgi:hypothetical protein